MGLFNKKKKVEQQPPQLPALPEVLPSSLLPQNEIPDVPPGLPQIETNSLPDLPEPATQNQNNFSYENAYPQNATEEIPNIPAQSVPETQKTTPIDSEKPMAKSIELKKHPGVPIRKIRVVEMDENNLHYHKDMPNESRLSKSRSSFKPSPSAVKEAEPVFIRLDKFQTTIEIFEEIKNKVEEIEGLLIKTKETKQKEEQELMDWEKEIQVIKSRIDSIDRNILNKLD